MGGFYGSIHVRTEEPASVRAVLEVLSSERGIKFLLAPVIDGWVGVFPQDNGQDMTVATALSEKLCLPLIQVTVHDDDVFVYEFHEDGKPVDSYNSGPDYFGGESKERGGNVERLKTVLPDVSKRNELKRLLEDDGFTFEVERLEKFAELLGLTNAVTAYEYLQDGERDGIKHWKKFVHIPDPTAEKATKKAAKAKIKADFERMKKEGLLVVDLVGAKTAHPLFPASPVWCIEPTTSDVLLAWTGNPIGSSVPTRLIRINVRTGVGVLTNVEFSSHVSCMAVSPTGKWLVVGCAFGSWKTQVYDLADGRLVNEIPQSRAVSQVCFTKDGNDFLSLSENVLAVDKCDGTGTLKTIRLAEHGRAMAVHPGGDYVAAAVGSQGLLALVHLPTGLMVKRVLIQAKAKSELDFLEQIAPDQREKFLSELAASIPVEEFAREWKRSSHGMNPNQHLVSLSFGPSGNHLICGTNEGVCVLGWDHLLAAVDMASVPPFVFEAAEESFDDNGSPWGRRIYANPCDKEGKRILFAGLEGKVKFMNLTDGRIGDLLVPPLRRPFWCLELTPDRSALVGTAVHLGLKKKDAPKFQVWNYPMLCKAAGLEW